MYIAKKIKIEYANNKDLFKLENNIALAFGMNNDENIFILVDSSS